MHKKIISTSKTKAFHKNLWSTLVSKMRLSPSQIETKTKLSIAPNIEKVKMVGLGMEPDGFIDNPNQVETKLLNSLRNSSKKFTKYIIDAQKLLGLSHLSNIKDIKLQTFIADNDYAPEAFVVQDDTYTIHVNLKKMETNPKHFLKQIIKHEIVHAVLRQSNINDANLPRWFHEGVSIHFEANKLYPIKNGHPYNSFTNPKEWLLSEMWDHEQGIATIKYLVNNYGPQTIPKIISSIQNGKTFEQSIEELTNKSFNQFRADSLEYTKEQYVRHKLVQ